NPWAESESATEAKSFFSPVSGIVARRLRDSSLLALNALRLASRTGSEGGIFSFNQSSCLPFFQNRKHKCGPVAQPVLPTYPITCPCLTRVPGVIPLPILDM